MLHKEGYSFIVWSAFIGVLFCGAVYFIVSPFWLQVFLYLLSLVFFLLIVQFFRNPGRTTPKSPATIISPADGKVVVIEETMESEFFNAPRLQLSVFMSPFNVHVNRYPVSGTVEFVKYHPGKYLVAWHPKSSTENERNTVVVKTAAGQQVLFRQIAGAMARRIKYYCHEGTRAEQGEEMGFIKFGSRVDIFLPLNVKLHIQLNDAVKGGETILAEFA